MQQLTAWLRSVRQSEAQASAGFYLLGSLAVLWIQIKFALLPASYSTHPSHAGSDCPSVLLISWVAAVCLCPRRS